MVEEVGEVDDVLELLPEEEAALEEASEAEEPQEVQV